MAVCSFEVGSQPAIKPKDEEEFVDQDTTFTHLADTFIESDLQCIQAIHIYFCQYVCSLGIEPTIFVQPTQCSTTEPQEDDGTLLSIYGTLCCYRNIDTKLR